MFGDWRNVQQRVSTASNATRVKDSSKSFFPGILGAIGQNESELKQTLDLDAGVYSLQGHRPYQEDEYAMRPFIGDGLKAPESHLFAIFDGHAGGRASKFLSNSFGDFLIKDPVFDSNIPFALKRSYLIANDQFLKQAEKMKLHDGSCGLSCILREGKLTVANVGDCRAILIHRGNALQITIDHKPYDPEERKRIASLGGTVVYSMGTARVNGILAVSRAFGNRTIKSVIRADADIFVHDFVIGDEFLIMASDGLWDVLSNKDVGEICKKYEEFGAKRMSEELVNIALNKGSMDNTTALVVCLKKYIEKWLIQKYPKFIPVNKSMNENGMKQLNSQGFRPVPKPVNHTKMEDKIENISPDAKYSFYGDQDKYIALDHSVEIQNLFRKKIKNNDEDLDEEVEMILGKNSTKISSIGINTSSSRISNGRPVRMSPLSSSSSPSPNTFQTIHSNSPINIPNSNSFPSNPSPLQVFHKRPTTTSSYGHKNSYSTSRSSNSSNSHKY